MRAELLFAILLLAPAAHAQVDPEATYKEGIELRKQGSDAAALAKFEAAYAAGKAPKARAQMALAEQALGRWVDAERHLLEALAVADDPWIGKQRATLEESLSEIRKHLGKIEVVGAPDGAEIVVSGNVAGVAPLASPLRVEVGSYTIEAKKPGYYPGVRVITVESDGTSRCDLAMKPIEAPKPPAVTIAPPPPKPKPEAPAPIAKSSQSPWFYVAVGSAVGLAAFGTTALLIRNGSAHAYNSDPDCLGRGAPDELSACSSRVSSVRTWQTVSIVSFIGAAAVTGVAIATYRRTPTTSVSLACGASFMSVGCAATF
jgi:hypothetical protein